MVYNLTVYTARVKVEKKIPFILTFAIRQSFYSSNSILIKM